MTNNKLDVIITIERKVIIMRTNIAIVCSFCREVHVVEVKLAQYKAWQNGEPIQNVMSDLTPGEQQRLITGLCPRCQAEMFRK